MKKGHIYNFIKFKLHNDPNWQVKALMAIFEFQTKTEQESETTIIHNDVGFTGCDGHILTSFAKQWIKRKWLSDKQMFILAKKMPKYWKQIYNISNKVTLDTMAATWQPPEQQELFHEQNVDLTEHLRDPEEEDPTRGHLNDEPTGRFHNYVDQKNASQGAGL